MVGQQTEARIKRGGKWIWAQTVRWEDAPSPWLIVRHPEDGAEIRVHAVDVTAIRNVAKG